MNTIGLDVGGTHTDGVILNAEGKAVAWGKTTTTPHLGDGIRTIIAKLLVQANIKPDAIQRVVMGTTHATNAIFAFRRSAAAYCACPRWYKCRCGGRLLRHAAAV